MEWHGRYEGTVECMTREEWEGQARALWADLTDERGRLRIQRDAERGLNTGSIEGAAQATLENVYGAATLRWAMSSRFAHQCSFSQLWPSECNADPHEESA